MCGKNSFMFCYCTLLFIVLSLEFQSNNTTSEKNDNLTMQIEFDENPIRNCNKTSELVQYNLHKNYTNNSQDNFNNTSDKNQTVLLCCPLANRLVNKKCIAEENEYVFPDVYSYSNDSLQSENKRIDEFNFQLIVHEPCKETVQFDPDLDDYTHRYVFLVNGSLYLPYFEIFIESTSYCLAVVDNNQFSAIICKKNFIIEIIKKESNNTVSDFSHDMYKNKLVIVFCRVVSMLCLLIIFLVYSILPKLQNIHSFMLCRFSSLLFIAYISDILDIMRITIQIYPICFTIAAIGYFCSLANSFWLCVISFDMWWSFRKLDFLQRNVKLQKKKELIYSIFAWGGSMIITIICVIMDFIPESVSKTLVGPGFGVNSCWFYNDEAYLLYYYFPRTICIISSICLSISTALKIAHYEKSTVRHLRDSESRVYNDNKQWFNLYLKLFFILFIIMAINWIISTGIIGSLIAFDIVMSYILLLTFVMDTIQDICIFIIFVCKKTIMRLLLEYFCSNINFKTSTHSN